MWFAILMKIAPLSGNVGSSVKYDNALVHDMIRIVLNDHTHDPSDKLDERRKVAEDAENRRHGLQRVIESLTKLSHLDNDIKLMVFESLHDALIGHAVLA